MERVRCGMRTMAHFIILIRTTRARLWKPHGETPIRLRPLALMARSSFALRRRLNLYALYWLTKYLSFIILSTCDPLSLLTLALIRAQSDTNQISWSPDRFLLASCSDDHTVKIWHVEEEQPLHILRDHTKEVYSTKWSLDGSYFAT